MLFFTLHFALKKQFKDLSSVKHFETGYWSLSEILSMLEGGNQRIVKYFMEKSGVRFAGGRTPLTFANLRGPEFDFEACYKSKVITGYRKELLQKVSYICDAYRCNDPTFTEDRSAFTPPPPPLRPKPQQDPLSLPLMPIKMRRARSDGRTLRTLQTQEKKSSTSQNMRRWDDVSWHPRCAPEVERPELDRVSIHVGKKGESRPKSGTRLQISSKNQPLPVKTQKKIGRKSSDEHRSKNTPLPGQAQPKSEKKSMPLPAQTQQKSENPSLPAKTKKKLERKSSEEHKSMSQQKSEINSFDKHSSRPKPKPRKEGESGAKKVDRPRSNKRDLNLANRPEQKEGSHKLSEAKNSEPPREQRHKQDSTKSHDSEKSNRRRLPKDSNVPSSAIKDATQNERKSFAIGTRVTLFGLNNLEFNGKVGVIETPLGPLGRQDVYLEELSQAAAIKVSNLRKAPRLVEELSTKELMTVWKTKGDERAIQGLEKPELITIVQSMGTPDEITEILAKEERRKAAAASSKPRMSQPKKAGQVPEKSYEQMPNIINHSKSRHQQSGEPLRDPKQVIEGQSLKQKSGGKECPPPVDVIRVYADESLGSNPDAHLRSMDQRRRDTQSAQSSRYPATDSIKKSASTVASRKGRSRSVESSSLIPSLSQPRRSTLDFLPTDRRTQPNPTREPRRKEQGVAENKRRSAPNSSDQRQRTNDINCTAPRVSDRRSTIGDNHRQELQKQKQGEEKSRMNGERSNRRRDTNGTERSDVVDQSHQKTNRVNHTNRRRSDGDDYVHEVKSAPRVMKGAAQMNQRVVDNRDVQSAPRVMRFSNGTDRGISPPHARHGTARMDQRRKMHGADPVDIRGNINAQTFQSAPPNMHDTDHISHRRSSA